MADKLTIIGPALCGLIYAITAIAFMTERRGPWALVYWAYALANVGMIWASILDKAKS